VHVPLGKEQVFLGLGVYVRDAVFVAVYVDRSGQAFQRDGPSCFWMRPLEDQCPGSEKNGKDDDDGTR
jgi:hypothetical protein